MKTEHEVYIGTDLIQSFTNSAIYDTATPAQWCISELKRLKTKIENGNTLRIVSNGKEYRIENTIDLKEWITNIFLGGFEEYVFI